MANYLELMDLQDKRALRASVSCRVPLFVIVTLTVCSMGGELDGGLGIRVSEN